MKTITTLSILFLAALSYGQEVSVNYNKHTLIRLELQDFQRKNGYFHAGAETEIGNNYTRYAMNVGYTFNNLFIKKLEIKPIFSYAGVSEKGFYASLTFGYEIKDSRFKVQFVNQYTDRYDAFLGMAYKF